jgi:hypothetical protein
MVAEGSVMRFQIRIANTGATTKHAEDLEIAGLGQGRR